MLFRAEILQTCKTFVEVYRFTIFSFLLFMREHLSSGAYTPCPIERDFISYFDIKEKIKELGSNPWDSVYYQKKVANGNSMVELTNDAGVMML